MPEIKANDGAKVHYMVHGSGPLPVLYLHWMGGDVSTWEALWAVMDSGRCRHVGIDARGHGYSEQAPCMFTNERLARDVLHVADSLGIDRFVLVGHSFGGKVGLRLAAMVPERVAGLILIGSVGVGTVPLDRALVETILSRASDLAFVRETFQPWFKVWPRPEIDRALEAFARTPAWALRAVCDIAMWTDIAGEVGRLATPAMIIAGEHDPVYGPAYQRDAVLPAVPGARMAVVDAGHGLVFERPKEIAAACEEFQQQLQ